MLSDICIQFCELNILFLALERVILEKCQIELGWAVFHPVFQVMMINWANQAQVI